MRIFVFLLIIFAILPNALYAQTSVDKSASSSSPRNKLQLLSSDLITAENRFVRLTKRLNALILRLDKINLILGKRLLRLDTTSTVLRRFNDRMTGIADELKEAKGELQTFPSLWETIKTDGERSDLLDLKNRLNLLIDKLENIKEGQITLVRDFKKYKLTNLSEDQNSSESAILN